MDAEATPDLAEQIEAKMSKSKPETCIFIHDSEEDIVRKIKKAHCPPDQVIGNPITEMIQYIVFDMKDIFKIERDEKYGGDIVFESYKSFEKAYLAGNIHPMDLKVNLAKAISEILKPSRLYFDKHEDIIKEVGKL